MILFGELKTHKNKKNNLNMCISEFATPPKKKMHFRADMFKTIGQDNVLGHVAMKWWAWGAIAILYELHVSWRIR